MSIREATYLCPDLLCLPRDPDREARAFSAVIDAFDSVAAGVECVRPGLARCRVRGPARWHGSEEAAASALVSAIEEAVGVECFGRHCRWASRVPGGRTRGAHCALRR